MTELLLKFESDRVNQYINWCEEIYVTNKMNVELKLDLDLTIKNI